MISKTNLLDRFCSNKVIFTSAPSLFLIILISLYKLKFLVGIPSIRQGFNSCQRVFFHYLYKFYNKGPISCHDNASSYPPLLISLHQCLCNTNTIYCHINILTITTTHWQCYMFLVTCELIDKLSASLSGDRQ